MPIAPFENEAIFLFNDLHRFTLDHPPAVSEKLYSGQKELARAMEKRLQAYVETGILTLRARHLGLPEKP